MMAEKMEKSQTIYALANCAVLSNTALTNYAASISGRPQVYLNVFARAIAAMFEGRSWRLSNKDYRVLKGSKNKRHISINLCIKDKSLTNLPALDPNATDGFIWSPFTDIVIIPREIYSDQGDWYPWCISPLITEFKKLPRLTGGEILDDWERLDVATQAIPTRVMITYTLNNFSKNHVLMPRFCELTEVSKIFFKSRGWLLYEPNSTAAPDKYWAHYLTWAMYELHKRLYVLFKGHEPSADAGFEYSEQVNTYQLRLAAKGRKDVMQSISPHAKIGKDTFIGDFVVIEDGVIIGNNVIIGHHVTLRAGTKIGDKVRLGDYCRTTGACVIGSGFEARTGCVIARGVKIGPNVFFGAGVITASTYDIPAKKKVRTIIARDVIIGSGVNIAAGASIAKGIQVGAGSLVLKPLERANSVYVGSPAGLLR